MPDWLANLLYAVGAFITLVTFVGVIRNKVIRPLMKGYAQLLALLSQIRDASTGVQKLAREVESLAGAISNFVIGIHEHVAENTQRISRLEEMRELVIDLQADIERHLRDPGGHA